MKKITISPKIIITVSLIVCFVIGYFVGREHVKYTLRKTVTEAFRPLSEMDSGDKPKIAGMAIQQEKRDYLQYIQIYDLEYAEYKSLGDLNRRIKGKLKNNGDKTLKKVVIQFTFLDKDMKPIFEDVDEVYIFQDWEFRPIKPNYIAEIYYSGDDVPEEWSGKFEYEIIDITFWKDE